MKKHYRVLQDNFLWKKGAILEQGAINGAIGYSPIDDIWNQDANSRNEYITSNNIEGNPEYFERVYQDTLTGNIYRTKDQMIAMYEKAFK